MKKMSLIFGALSLIFLLATLPVASACSCSQPTTVEEEFNAHEVVFVGKAIAVEEGTVSASTTVRFEVQKQYKGEEPQEIKTPSSSAACGYFFEKDKEYLVYAQTIGGETRVNLCSRTTLVSEAERDIAYLDTNHPAIITSDGEDREVTFWQKLATFFKNFFN